MPKEVEEMEGKSKDLMDFTDGQLYLVSWDDNQDIRDQDGNFSIINKSKYLIFERIDLISSSGKNVTSWTYPTFDYVSPGDGFCIYHESITDIKEITDKDELLILNIR